MSLSLEIDDTSRRNSLSALRWDSAWIDPALRRMAETAAQRAGLGVEAWMERAIRRACHMPGHVATAAALPQPVASPNAGEPEPTFALGRGAQDDDATPSEPTYSFPEAAPPAAPWGQDSLLADGLASEFPEPTYDDAVPALAEAAHPTAADPEAEPLFADAALSAGIAPRDSAATTPWRATPRASGRDARGSSVIWAAGIAAVLAFCAVVAVRDPSLLHGHMAADNDHDVGAATPSAVPAIAANTPLHVQPRASDHSVALAMVPPPPSVAENDETQPIASPKIELAPPAPVASAPAPAPTETAGATSPAPKSADVPPPAVALAEQHPVQMAALPSSGEERTTATSPASDSDTDQNQAAAEPASSTSAAPAKHVAAELPPATPAATVAKQSTQIAMAPTAASPSSSPAKSAGAALAQDQRTAAELQTRVAAGDHIAEYRLGILYALGKGVPRDYEHAAKLLRASADAGLAEAQYDYGVLCDKGLGVSRNSAEAARWYSKAAQQGHPPAALNLGYAYAEGLGVARNLPEAARWFRRAAEAGLINAQFNLAYMFEQGAGVSKSLVDAYAWYSVAAEKGDQGAQTAIDRIAAKLTPHEMQFAKARIRAVRRVIHVQN